MSRIRFHRGNDVEAGLRTARANDDPIRPAPTMVSRVVNSPASRRGRQYSGERLQKPGVFFRQARAHPEVIGQTVFGNRSHDHAFVQQCLIDRSCSFDPREKVRKFPAEGMKFSPRRSKSVPQLLHAGRD